MTEETQVPTTVETTTNKPGWKTTEFWLSLATAIAGLAVILGFVTPTEAGQIASSITQAVGGIMTVVSVAGYSWSRGLAKKNDINAIIEILSKIPQVK